MECKNCLNYGHKYEQCRHPLISYGIILKHTDKKNVTKYLMCQRLYSLSLIEIMKGRYPINDLIFIKALVSRLSKNEFEQLKKNSDLENFIKTVLHKSDHKSIMNDKYFDSNKHKYEKLHSLISNKTFFNDIVSIDENEWGFSKGRRNNTEVPLETALREFKEETGIVLTMDNIIQTEPIIEIFTGTNGKLYKHVYYLAKYYENIEDAKFQNNNEISQIKWFTKEECINHIDKHYTERKKIINQL